MNSRFLLKCLYAWFVNEVQWLGPTSSQSYITHQWFSNMEVIVQLLFHVVRAEWISYCTLLTISDLTRIWTSRKCTRKINRQNMLAHWTETGLLTVSDALCSARTALLSSALILFDLSAAFDTVCCYLLLPGTHAELGHLESEAGKAQLISYFFKCSNLSYLAATSWWVCPTIYHQAAELLSMETLFFCWLNFMQHFDAIFHISGFNSLKCSFLY